MAEDPDQDDAPDGRRGAVIGLGIVVLLIIGGWFLVHVLRNTARMQDCLMSGRTNCASVEAVGPTR